MCLQPNSFIWAEVKYNKAVSGPVTQLLTRPLRNVPIAPTGNFQSFSLTDFINAFAGNLATTLSQRMEEYYCHSCPYPYPPPLFSPFTQLIVIIVFVGSSIFLLKGKSMYREGTQISWLMTLSFILGLFIYNNLFRGNISQNYFSVILPIFILILSQVAMFMYKKFKFIFLLFMLSYFFIKKNTLLNSSVSHPLYQKRELVKSSVNSI